MRILVFIRKVSFWLLDCFKGCPIRRHYNDIKYISENYSSANAIKRREKHLNNILKHAQQSTVFYKNNSSGLSLSDFPIIDKRVVQNNYDDFNSDLFCDKKNAPRVTSGSTGTPFKIFHDQNKRDRSTADIIYFGKKNGFDIGDKLYYVKVWNDINMKSLIRQWMENIEMYSVFNYNDEGIKKFISDLRNDKSKKAITCFASTCNVIVNYLDSIKAKPEDFNIKSIIANSDALDNKVKDKMEYYFKIPVVARYSNMENGLLGMQRSNSGYEYEINWASYVIEILDVNEDKPAKLGDYGRVVVTDLFNYCMPLIRYDTGDVAIMELDEKDKGEAPILKTIEGRKVDLIRNTEGEVITSHIVTVNMWKYTELKQYQFVQKGNGHYMFRLNPHSTFTKEEELISEFKGYLGNDATIDIEYIDEVPQLSSGKRRLVVNEM
ncbi:CoF synthetase [Flavivirga spongiicola]|uniref:CoF synthetase n=1 Tax=Flavivirga spongiicola TaxID=421621 RepID=A0ABU7XXF2_9FLAO|nr:CoF synthetase [Flavivirga sp. MEBiC05379]MDO5980457.1 CoF synthetase [Flavivirga sp. MEBiC05379]